MEGEVCSDIIWSGRCGAQREVCRVCVVVEGRGGAYLHIERNLPRARTRWAEAEQILRELRGVRWDVVLQELKEEEKRKE